MSTLLDHFEAALASESGVALHTGSTGYANFLRRRFYAERDKLRRRGNSRFDDLSFLVRRNGELWIVPRVNDKSRELPSLETRHLDIEETPGVIRSRGRHRFSFHRIT